MTPPWARRYGHQINKVVGAEFTGRRTICGREWMEIRSTMWLVLNLQDDTLPVADNGWKSDPQGTWC